MAKILIIDDDIFICKAIQKQLINKGFNAEVAFTGESGLKMVKTHTFDLVLCDFRLPDKDGLKVLKEIKRIDNHIPVIIITAYADVRIAVKLIKQGAYDYMVKPLHSEEILSLVKQLAGKNKFIQTHEGGDNFIMGSSRLFREAVGYASKVAPTDMAVLI